jgi:2-polyprenyl-3-methyl-5-hydroxy-6-metoxy-1,4-benzoquinol methylase
MIPIKNTVIPFVNPVSGTLLQEGYQNGQVVYIDEDGSVFPYENDVLSLEGGKNYTDTFGFQWSRFKSTQIDEAQGINDSEVRFFVTTGWIPGGLENNNVLEAGCGAGRFTSVLLNKTLANVYSIDYSESINVARENNERFLHRLRLARASLYRIPFPDESFDKVICIGVLQHTPSVEESLKSLIRKVKPGGELVVDFYQLKGWFTKVHCKYLLRPLTTRMQPEMLLKVISQSMPIILQLFDFLCKLKLGILTRFLPVADIRSYPKGRAPRDRLQCAILDTFDAFSPAYDHPTSIERVVEIVTKQGLTVSFAGKVLYQGSQAAVVRATRT